MYLEFSESSNYPKFDNFIKTEIPKILDNVFICSNLLGFSGLPQNEMWLVREALKSHNKPIVTPQYMVMKFAGMFDSSKPIGFFFNKQMIESFEMDFAKENTQKFMLATLLHELVHYLDYKYDAKLIDGVYDETQDKWVPKCWTKGVFGDNGGLFELATWGFLIPYWKLGESVK